MEDFLGTQLHLAAEFFFSIRVSHTSRVKIPKALAIGDIHHAAKLDDSEVA